MTTPVWVFCAESNILEPDRQKKNVGELYNERNSLAPFMHRTGAHWHLQTHMPTVIDFDGEKSNIREDHAEQVPPPRLMECNEHQAKT